MNGTVLIHGHGVVNDTVLVADLPVKPLEGSVTVFVDGEGFPFELNGTRLLVPVLVYPATVDVYYVPEVSESDGVYRIAVVNGSVTVVVDLRSRFLVVPPLDAEPVTVNETHVAFRVSAPAEVSFTVAPMVNGTGPARIEVTVNETVATENITEAPVGEIMEQEAVPANETGGAAGQVGEEVGRKKADVSEEREAVAANGTGIEAGAGQVVSEERGGDGYSMYLLVAAVVTAALAVAAVLVRRRR